MYNYVNYSEKLLLVRGHGDTFQGDTDVFEEKQTESPKQS